MKIKKLGITISTWYEYSDHIYMNWGWYGSSNGWIDQASWPSFNNNRRMWYDLMPRYTMSYTKPWDIIFSWFLCMLSSVKKYYELNTYSIKKRLKLYSD